jgi:hypothetical protein
MGNAFVGLGVNFISASHGLQNGTDSEDELAARRWWLLEERCPVTDDDNKLRFKLRRLSGPPLLNGLGMRTEGYLPHNYMFRNKMHVYNIMIFI